MGLPKPMNHKKNSYEKNYPNVLLFTEYLVVTFL